MSNTTLPNGNSTGIRKASNSFKQTTIITVAGVVLAVVSVIMVARILLYFVKRKTLRAGDYLVFLAYAIFVAQCILYINIAPLNDRVFAVQEGKVPYYPELLADAHLLGRLYFPVLISYWILLWLVKFGLLLFYRKLMLNLPGVYDKIWWSIVIFCAIVSSPFRISGSLWRD
ncbi:cfem domain-containing [Pyrenophora seminiperda CCB06]|uniref:Cfem domain-containing n=1 Tax=Pyrenophora seminiperda CCB06 TaxID=1302712 RepID=A0A3M7M2R9_9PLEO|nr:cfem domain-containing [Pyrenophora seminiperda CCB06]